MTGLYNLVIIGATGSLGGQCLEIVRRYPEQFRVVGLSAHRNRENLEQLALEFGARQTLLSSSSPEELIELVDERVDHLLLLDHGLGSRELCLKALAMSKRVSIANKELIVCHGQELVYLAKECQSELIPLDSELNALHQCLRGEALSDVSRVIITASGGPFLNRADLGQVTPEQALRHPNWMMGAKTSVDSATLVNKALEVIQVQQLLGIPYDRIEVRLHPESLVHAIVEFCDGSSKMLAYHPDMRIALGYALFYPQRAPGLLSANKQPFDYDRPINLSPLEAGRFPCFDTVMDIAHNKPEQLSRVLENDQVAIQKFLKGDIQFDEIGDFLLKGIL
ncbi:MAG: hypothetical protein Q8P95_00585 [bacterium]|nr:hypothetical protein [bacterium]